MSLKEGFARPEKRKFTDPTEYREAETNRELPWGEKFTRPPNAINLLVKIARSKKPMNVGRNETKGQREYKADYEDFIIQLGATNNGMLNIPYRALDHYLNYVLDDDLMVANEYLLITHRAKKDNEDGWKLDIPTYYEQNETDYLLMLLVVNEQKWGLIKEYFDKDEQDYVANLFQEWYRDHEERFQNAIVNRKELYDDYLKQYDFKDVKQNVVEDIEYLYTIRSVLSKDLDNLLAKYPYEESFKTYVNEYKQICLNTERAYDEEALKLQATIVAFIKEKFKDDIANGFIPSFYTINQLEEFTNRRNRPQKYVKLKDEEYKEKFDKGEVGVKEWALTVSKVGHNEGNTPIRCPICRDTHRKVECIETNCLHFMGATCFETLVRENRNCPVCGQTNPQLMFKFKPRAIRNEILKTKKATQESSDKTKSKKSSTRKAKSPKVEKPKA